MVTKRDGERNARYAEPAIPAADAVRHRPENTANKVGTARRTDSDADARGGICETVEKLERKVFFRPHRVDRHETAVQAN